MLNNLHCCTLFDYTSREGGEARSEAVCLEQSIDPHLSSDLWL